MPPRLYELSAESCGRPEAAAWFIVVRSALRDSRAAVMSGLFFIAVARQSSSVSVPADEAPAQNSVRAAAKSAVLSFIGLHHSFYR